MYFPDKQRVAWVVNQIVSSNLASPTKYSLSAKLSFRPVAEEVR